MKTYCKPKDVDIEDTNFNMEAVHCAFGNGKLRRRDFRTVLTKTGKIPEPELFYERKEHKCHKIIDAIDAVAEQETQKIRDECLNLKPVRQFKRIDGIKMKERNLCQESPEQQVHEYILVHALQPLFRAKFLPAQFGSIPGKGQVAGTRLIERIIRKRILGKLDAVKGDVHHAYPSTTTLCVITLLKRDVGKNKKLIWYAGAVTENYPDGVLLIGGYFSTWAFNYIMSYVLRYLMSLVQVRRGSGSKLVREIVCYADDFVLIGHASQLMKAMKKATRWAKSALGLEIKRAWQEVRFASFEEEKRVKAARAAGSHYRTPALDMMGFAVRRTYTIVRKGVFRRIRRQLLRAAHDLATLGYVPHWRASKLTAYNGWFTNSDSTNLEEKYDIEKIMRASRWSVARWSMIQNRRKAA